MMPMEFVNQNILLISIVVVSGLGLLWPMFARPAGSAVNPGEATLLINPRPTGEAFTAYSFPSKNLEYMASGTPVLTTKLSGMPREYDAYAYLFDDESVEGMAKTLAQVLAEPRETLHARGQAAKAFVLEQKSNTAQAKRLLAFVQSLESPENTPRGEATT